MLKDEEVEELVESRPVFLSVALRAVGLEQGHEREVNYVLAQRAFEVENLEEGTSKKLCADKKRHLMTCHGPRK